MAPEPPAEALLSALEDYHRRRSLGEAVDVDAYREKLDAAAFERFRVLVAQSAAPVRGSAPPTEAQLPRLLGPYLLERVVGGGGMGVVYSAFHCALARRVAVKVLPRALEADEDAVTRFRGEARKCAQVRHPNIVTVYEEGEVDGQLYYAMELIEGRTLQAHIDEGTVPPVRELARAVAELADGLETLHRAGVVHRDVKPANVIVRSADGKMVLADFGLARMLTSPRHTQTGTAIGTPPYMSPEQILGRVTEVDARSDVYGLGVTLYHAITGRLPFASRETSDLFRLIVTQRPEPLHRVRPDVDVAMEKVVLKALEKRKDDRYTTAGDMRDDLRRVVVGETPEGEPVPGWKHALRRLRPFAVPIAAVVLLLVGATVWWMRRPATLGISVAVPVEVVVDDVPRGRTAPDRPLVIELPAGEHRVRVGAGGDFSKPMRLDLGRGQHLFVEVPIAEVPLGAVDDPRHLDALAREALPDISNTMARTFQAWNQFGRDRAGGRDLPTMLFPRGAVRLADVATLDLEVPADFHADEDWMLVVQRDGKDLVPPRVWAPRKDEASPAASVPLPDDVRRALAVGDTVRWGVRPRRAGQQDPLAYPLASFTVVDTDPADVLRRIDERLVAQPARVRALFRARLLLAQGLATAAAREVLAAAPADARSFHEAATLAQAMTAASAALADTDLFRAAKGVVEAPANDALRDRRFAPPPPAAAPGR